MPKQTKQSTFDILRKTVGNPNARIHFIGIGGVSMYTLARLALDSGIKVSGSDRVIGDRVHDLVDRGAVVSAGHDAANVEGASLAVYSHAVAYNNPEIVNARKLGIPLMSRAEYMGAVMLDYRNRIGVSGSHGKSTTVAMLDEIMTHAGANPTVLSGADLSVGEPLKIGSKNLVVYEACEYKDSFLDFYPTITVGLNLELDHIDYFDDVADIRRSFVKGLGKATVRAVVNADDENLALVIPRLKSPVVTFGHGEGADYRYIITSFKECGFEFTIYKKALKIGDFELNIPGVFNVTNAAAAIVTAIEYGIDVETVREAIAGYRGIPRRLEHIGVRHGRNVYYDYAHHPTEISASINAIKLFTGEHVTVVFKPHTYSRTECFWEDFRSALSLADNVILTDIYPAREDPIDGIDSRRLADEIGTKAIFCLDNEVVPHLDMHTHGVIIIMGAGDMDGIKSEILKNL